MNRVIWIVLDGVGAGTAPDSAAFGDAGADTLGHIREKMPGMKLPHLDSLGLDRLYGGQTPALGTFGRARELSMGKDTTTGHWEMAGIVRENGFPTYPEGFPPEVMEAFCRAVGRGAIGNVPASGTEIIERLGEEHLKTGSYIVYTSADSVFQIAAHEEIISREQLYADCLKARELLQGEHGVARVIARPFIGQPGAFVRTDGRHDYSLEPPYPMLLDRLQNAGVPVWAVGKIRDIFCGRGIDHHLPTTCNEEGVEATLSAMAQLDHGLIMTNLVDFDMLYGHRRDVEGFARALEAVDQGIGRIMEAMRPEDTLMICADHGCDPTWRGTDHTRELVPVFLYGHAVIPNMPVTTAPGFHTMGEWVWECLGE